MAIGIHISIILLNVNGLNAPTKRNRLAEWIQKQDLNVWFIPGGSDGQESACNAGDLGSMPGLGRSPGEGNGNPLPYSYLENSTEKPDGDGLQSMGSQESDTTEQLNTHMHTRTDSMKLIPKKAFQWQTSPSRTTPQSPPLRALQFQAISHLS